MILLSSSSNESHSVVSDSCDPMDCSSPGSSVQGILQARVLERVAIFFSIHGFFEKFFKVLSGELIKFLLNWFVYR